MTASKSGRVNGGSTGGKTVGSTGGQQGYVNSATIITIVGSVRSAEPEKSKLLKENITKNQSNAQIAKRK